MNVIWWFDSIWLWCYQHWIIHWRKRREKESLDKKKRRWNESDVESLVFLVHHKCTHVWRMKKCVSVWIRREWWWKSGRQGEKSGRKRGGKKGKREKVVLGKVLFVFVWLCLLPLPFFSLHPPHHHTHAHTHPPRTIHHDALVHTITCKQGCVLCCLFGSGQRDTHCIIHTPHSITWHHT